MNLIKIDPKEIQIFAEESGKFIFKPQAEEALDSLIKTRDLLIQTVDEVLEKIKNTGEKINPDFKGVKGEKYNIVKRQYGNRYTYKKAKVGQLGAFLKEVSYHTVNADSVDEYLKAVGELPDGIEEKEREYKMTIMKGGEHDDKD